MAMNTEIITPDDLKGAVRVVTDREAMPDWQTRFRPLTRKIAQAIIAMVKSPGHHVTIQTNQSGYFVFACCTGSFYLSRDRIADPLIQTITDPKQLLISLADDLEAQAGITEDDSAFPKRPVR